MTSQASKSELKIFTNTGYFRKPFEDKLKAYLGVTHLTHAERMDLTAQAKHLLKLREDRGVDATRLDPKLLFSTWTGNKLSTMITNTGLTPEQLARKANTTVESLLDPNNWDKEKYINEKGDMYEFEFDYNGTWFTFIGNLYDNSDPTKEVVL